MSTSLILTCFNEIESMPVLLDGVLGQTLLPSEMVVVDAGSTDGTLDVLNACKDRFREKESKLIIIVKSGVNIAAGRNIAIGKAENEFIVVTDAGCRLEPNWLELISEPLRNGSADFVGGFYVPDAHTRFQQMVASLTVGLEPGEDFLPSSRSVAFKKTLWEKAGQYPEWLKWGEDTLFDKLCLAAGARYSIAADAIVHWEVRRTLRAVIQQFRQYAYGDALARRYSISLVRNAFFYTLVLALVLAGHLVALLLIPALATLWILRKKIPRREWPYAVVIASFIQMTRSVGFVSGLFVGLFIKRTNS